MGCFYGCNSIPAITIREATINDLTIDNSNDFSFDSRLNICEINLLDSNELIIYENDIEIFKTTFKK